MNDALFSRRYLIPAVIGGIGLWLVVGFAAEAVGKPSESTGSSPGLLGHSSSWYLATFVASLVTGVALAFAQSRLRDARLQSAVLTGALMGFLGVLGLIAAGINAGVFEITALRAGILLLGVIGASVLVFVSRKRMRVGSKGS
jgi:hypothetical protein